MHDWSQCEGSTCATVAELPIHMSRFLGTTEERGLCGDRVNHNPLICKRSTSSTVLQKSGGEKDCKLWLVAAGCDID